MEPHSTSHQHGAGRMKALGLWSRCQEQWRGGDGGLLHQWHGLKLLKLHFEIILFVFQNIYFFIKATKGRLVNRLQVKTCHTV